MHLSWLALCFFTTTVHSQRIEYKLLGKDLNPVEVCGFIESGALHNNYDCQTWNFTQADKAKNFRALSVLNQNKFENKESRILKNLHFDSINGIRDVFNFSNIAKWPFTINVLDDQGMLIPEAVVDGEYVDLRRQPVGKYTININAQGQTFTTEYKKDFQTIHPCENLLEDNECSLDNILETVTGTWEYRLITPGRFKLNADGTYEDIKEEILVTTITRRRTWRIEDKRLVFDTGSGYFSFPLDSYNCNEIKIDGTGLFDAFSFYRVDPCTIYKDHSSDSTYPRKYDEEGSRIIYLKDSLEVDYSYNLEIVNDGDSREFDSYLLDVKYVDRDSSNGIIPSEFREFLKLDREEFRINELGFWEAEPIHINADKLLTKFDLSINQVSSNDYFIFKGSLIMNDGYIYNSDNTTFPSYRRSRGVFYDFNMPIECPEELVGYYHYETTNIWCDSTTTLTGVVSLEKLFNGEFSFDDWSFGAYTYCYGGFFSFNLSFSSECGQADILTDNVDSFGDIWTISSIIQEDRWTLNWSNTYGESGTSTLFYPKGESWPLSIESL